MGDFKYIDRDPSEAGTASTNTDKVDFLFMTKELPPGYAEDLIEV